MTRKKKNWFSNLRLEFNTIQGKVTYGFLILGLLGASLIFYPLYVYRNIIERYEFTFKNTVRTEYYCSRIEVALSKSNSTLDNYLITNNEIFSQKRQRIWSEDYILARDSLFAFTQRWQNINAVALMYDANVRAEKLQLEQTFIEDEYRNSQLVGGLDENITTSSDNRKSNHVKKLELQTEEILSILDHLIEIQEEEIQFSQKLTSDDLGQLPYVMVILILIVIVSGVSISFYTITSILDKIRDITSRLNFLGEGNIPETIQNSKDELNPIISGINGLTSNLKTVKQFAYVVGEGNFDSELLAFGGGGELGEALTKMRNSLKQVSDEDIRRNWVTNGLNIFAEILRENNEIESLSEAVISQLVKYLGANQGSIYIAEQNEGEERLVSKAFYAFDIKKYSKTVIEKGEGLLGEAFQEKRTVYMNDIPENYIRITSGLGDANPRSLLIVPLMLNENVNGMIEIASYKGIEKFEIQFVEKVCESVASTIINIENNQKTQKLLETAQMTTEMMRAQEEEMRQNLEELQAIQEELNRQKKDLDTFSTAINLSAILIELSPERLIMNVNDMFCDAFLYTKSEVLNQPNAIYIPKDVLRTKEYEETWVKLLNGEPIAQTVQRLRKDGSPIWMNAHFIPVTDEHIGIEKIICICSDITNEVLEKQKMESEIKSEKYRLETALEHQKEILNDARGKFRNREKELMRKISTLKAELGQT